MTMQARFFDGKKIQPFEATIIVHSTGITIIFQDENKWQHIEWHTADLQIMEQPIQGRKATIAHQTMPGARLIISDQTLYEAILPLIPKQNIKYAQVYHPWRNITLLFLASIIIFGGFLWSIPKSAQLLSQIIPYQWDNQLGQHAIYEMIGERKECVSKPGLNALNKLTQRLISPIHAKHPIDVRVIQFGSEDINAFAVPGNHIIIMSGLLHFAKNPDEVAGVLAHEIGHALKHHPTQSLIRQLGMSVIWQATFGSSFDFASTLLHLKYSREDERQADEMALHLLKGAHINMSGFLHFFKRLASFEGSTQPAFSEYLASHPLLSERIKMIEAQMQDEKSTPSLSLTEWQALQSICSESTPLLF